MDAFSAVVKYIIQRKIRIQIDAQSKMNDITVDDIYVR